MGNFRFRAKIATAHLAVSALLAGSAALLVFGFWYPADLASLSGGTSLFALLSAVDMVLGPVLTAVIASASKPRRELARDIAIIATVQLAALGYGLHAIAQARPVAVVWEVNLFRVVTANEVSDEELALAAPALHELPWAGPRELSVMKPADPAEQLRTIELGLNGVPLAALARHWRPRADAQSQIDRVARPVGELLARYPGQREHVERVARRAGMPAASLRCVPIQGRAGFWTALLAASGDRIVGYLPQEFGT